MTMYLLITFCLTAGYTVPPEPSEVPGIRELYSEVKDRMEDEYSFYRTVIDINSTDLPYPAVGDYREEITLYWTLDEEYGGKILHFIIISCERAAWTEYGEILYHNGEAVFTYYSRVNYDEILEESRRWFCGGEEIHATCRTISDDVIEYHFPPESDYMRDPETLMEIFRML